MPDMAKTLYPRVVRRHRHGYANKTGLQGTVDPRNLHTSIVNVTSHPYLKHARVLPVVLNPGDALYIPTSWWHYVESAPMPSNRTHKPLSIAVNFLINSLASLKSGKEFQPMPCNPAQWTLLQTIQYQAIEFMFYLQVSIKRVKSEFYIFLFCFLIFFIMLIKTIC